MQQLVGLITKMHAFTPHAPSCTHALIHIHAHAHAHAGHSHSQVRWTTPASWSSSVTSSSFCQIVSLVFRRAARTYPSSAAELSSSISAALSSSVCVVNRSHSWVERKIIYVCKKSYVNYIVHAQTIEYIKIKNCFFLTIKYFHTITHSSDSYSSFLILFFFFL